MSEKLLCKNKWNSATICHIEFWCQEHSNSIIALFGNDAANIWITWLTCCARSSRFSDDRSLCQPASPRDRWAWGFSNALSRAARLCVGKLYCARWSAAALGPPCGGGAARQLRDGGRLYRVHRKIL